MQVKILVARGKVKQQRVQLELPVIVGRSTDADLTINHPSISRQHCELFEAEGRVRVRDLGSTNGTRVGGEKVAEAVLRPHDRFSIGPFTLVVDYREAPDAAALQGEAAVGAGDAAEGRVRKPLPEASSVGAEADEAAGLSWEEGSSSEQLPPDRPAQPAPAASPRAKPPAQPTPTPSVSQSKRPPNSASNAAAASPSAAGTDPELGIDLDELLAGLEGLNLKDFLKGIE